MTTYLPTRRLAVLLAVPALPMLLLPSPATLALAAAFDAALLLVVLADLALSARPGELRVARRLPLRLSLGARTPVGWEIENRSLRPVAFEVVDDLPPDVDAPPAGGRIAASSRAEVTRPAVARRRGLHVFGDVHVRWRTPLGLLAARRRIPQRTEVKVYPSAVNVARYVIAARRHRLAELGMIATRQRGAGGSFESLREHVRGDGVAEVAWKATARRGRLMTRNYEADRSQHVLVMLDCGRLMTAEADGLTRLDHAVNAALLLTYVAMEQGDSIGLLAFSDRIESYVPPARGRGALARMNEALYRLEPRAVEPDHDLACRYLDLRHRKRSLIVIVTDVIDRDASSELLAHVARFARRHVAACVTLRGRDAPAVLAKPPETSPALFDQTVAIEMVARREEALRRMRSVGVDVLDVDPRDLTARLLGRYLELKRRRRI